MSNFTKGPWVVSGCYIKCEKGHIAQSKSIFLKGDALVANAHLIAAAPDMYAMLEKLIKAMDNHDAWWVNCPDSGGFDTNEMESLLKKARGE